MDRVQTDGARGNEAGKRDKKNEEEHQSKLGMKMGQGWAMRPKYVKSRGKDE